MGKNEIVSEVTENVVAENVPTEQPTETNEVIVAAQKQIAAIEQDLAELDNERKELNAERRKYQNVIKAFTK